MKKKSFLQTCIEMCIFEAVLVIVITVLLQYNFVFLKFINEFDSMLFYYFAPKEKHAGTPGKQLFFIDIDDATMSIHFEGESVYGRSTPRRLQAQVLEIIKTADPAVIVMDFDYREAHVDDDHLRQQLATAEVPIIIPRPIYSNPQSSCIESARTVNYEVSPRFIPGVFDNLAREGGRIFFARADVEYSFGYAVGFCTSATGLNVTGTQERIPAVALLAVSLAQRTPLVLPQQENLERFYIRVVNTSKNYNDGFLQFEKVPAYHVTAINSDLNQYKGSIIVIGASHSGSNDIHQTFEGHMSGGLVVSNAILQTLSGPIVQYDTKEGFLVDLLFVVLQSILICFINYLYILIMIRIDYKYLHQYAIASQYKKYVLTLKHYLQKKFFYCLDKILGLIIIPFFLLWALHATVLFKVMHVNTYVIILPALLSLLSLFFEHRRRLSEKISSLLFYLFNTIKKSFV